MLLDHNCSGQITVPDMSVILLVLGIRHRIAVLSLRTVGIETCRCRCCLTEEVGNGGTGRGINSIEPVPACLPGFVFTKPLGGDTFRFRGRHIVVYSTVQYDVLPCNQGRHTVHYLIKAECRRCTARQIAGGVFLCCPVHPVLVSKHIDRHVGLGINVGQSYIRRGSVCNDRVIVSVHSQKLVFRVAAIRQQGTGLDVIAVCIKALGYIVGAVRNIRPSDAGGSRNTIVDNNGPYSILAVFFVIIVCGSVPQQQVDGMVVHICQVQLSGTVDFLVEDNHIGFPYCIQIFVWLAFVCCNLGPCSTVFFKFSGLFIVHQPWFCRIGGFRPADEFVAFAYECIGRNDRDRFVDLELIVFDSFFR